MTVSDRGKCLVEQLGTRSGGRCGMRYSG